MGWQVLAVTGKYETSKNIDGEISKIIREYRDDAGGLIPVLQEVQELKGYLPREILEQIAAQMHISLAKVLGVATFYSQFYLQARGRHLIRVCSGTACHVRGGADIWEALHSELDTGDNGTTADFRFSLEKVSCLGACGSAPVLMIDEDIYPKLTKEKLPEIISAYH